MTSGDGLRFRTAITEMDDEEIYVRGYPLSDLIRGRSFAECTWLTLRGELPTAAQAAVFEAVLCGLMAYPAARRHGVEGTVSGCTTRSSPRTERCGPAGGRSRSTSTAPWPGCSPSSGSGRRRCT